MLCTKKRLTQRHRDVLSSSTLLLPDSAAGRAAPVVRLCGRRLATGECNFSSNSRIQNSIGITSEQHRTKSFGHQIDSRRTPLVILSLSISPETTTMVPSVIRRDPLRLPPYCMRQQQPRTNSATSTAKDSDITDDRQQPLTSDANHISIAEHSGSQRSGSSSPEFYIRGVVIGGKLKAEPSIDDPYHQPIDSRQHKPRHQQRFCDAIWRRRSREGEASDDDGDINDNDDDGDDDDENAQRIEDCSRIDELLRMDGYEMDRFGHLPGNSRTPTPMQRRRGWTPDIDAIYPEGKSPRRPLRTNTAPPRIPSPTTGQIIRIVFNK